MSVAVKICGVCTAADAAMAAAAGAAYIGVILAPGYRRTRTLEEAATIFAASSAQRVGVFVDPEEGAVAEAAARLRLDVVQLHGRESAALVRRLPAGPRIWKAIAVRSVADLARAEEYDGLVDSLLLDGWSERAAGGVGAAFDWAVVAAQRERLPGGGGLIVAGGLDAANVGRVITLLRPDVVDVSSGVEAAPGRKSAARVRAFIDAARAVPVAEGA